MLLLVISSTLQNNSVAAHTHYSHYGGQKGRQLGERSEKVRKMLADAFVPGRVDIKSNEDNILTDQSCHCTSSSGHCISKDVCIASALGLSLLSVIAFVLVGCIMQLALGYVEMEVMNNGTAPPNGAEVDISAVDTKSEPEKNDSMNCTNDSHTEVDKGTILQK